MNKYRVNMSDGHVAFMFEVEADNFKHAIEQAENAYPGCQIDSIYMILCEQVAG